MQELRAKMLIIGDSQVGKTSILTKFTNNVFNTHMAPIIGKLKHFLAFFIVIGTDYKTKKIHVEDKTIKLEIWDTAGQERFRCITQSFYRGCMGIMIVFDFTKIESFHNVETWLANLKQQASDNVVKVLVGNKLDLEREVKDEEIKKLVAEHNIPYFEVSAKTGENIQSTFEAMATMIYKNHLVGVKETLLDLNDHPSKDTTVNLQAQNQAHPNTEKRRCCG